MSASGLTCPSDTTASCYKNETSTVSSGSCSKTCTYKVANTPSCGTNAEITGSGTSCSCKCKSGYSGDPFSGCIEDCQKTNCSGYPYGGSTPYTIYTGYGHYDTCEPGCGESTRYKCKSGYTATLMSGTTYYCAQSGGGTGGGTGGGSGDNTKVCYCYNSCCGTSTTNCIAKCGGSAIAPYCKRKDVSQNQYCW